jgi:hypothetical protein
MALANQSDGRTIVNARFINRGIIQGATNVKHHPKITT